MMELGSRSSHGWLEGLVEVGAEINGSKRSHDRTDHTGWVDVGWMLDVDC